MKFDRSQFIQKFISETRENIQRLNDGILRLEKDPSALQELTDMMRVIHTVKGSSKMLNIVPVAAVAHAFEEALQSIHRLKIGIKPAMTDILLQGTDLLSALLEALPHQQEDAVPTAGVIERLNQCIGIQSAEEIQHGQGIITENQAQASETQTVKKEKSIVFDKSAFVKRFLTEMADHIQAMDQACQRLDVNREDESALEQGFRAAHTLKGSARMLKFESSSNIAQRIEMLFRSAREKKTGWGQLQTEIVLNTLDVLRQIHQRIAAGGMEDFRQAGILDLLDQAIAGQVIDANAIRLSLETSASVLASESAMDWPSGQETGDSLGERLIQVKWITREQLLNVNQNSDNRLPLGERLVAFGYISREQLNLALKEQQASRELLGHSEIKRIQDFELETAHVPAKTKTVEESPTIRVRLDKLDRLIKTVGELITAQMQSSQNLPLLRKLQTDLRRFTRSVHECYYRQNRYGATGDAHGDELIQTGQQMLEMTEQFGKQYRDSVATFDLLVNDIQSSVMSMRMIALSTIFDAYPRAVRDLAKNLSKDVELLIEGRETELDRKMVEKLNEPLIHLIRNAIDHGIEPPDARLKNGKPAKGLLRIAARNEGTSIVIEIEDDGRGLDLDKIKRKALAKGLIIHETDLQRMSENDVTNLIFLPGFSTADFITDISGRGFGMDVVKQGVENLKGYISIFTKPGRGTLFRVHLPLTLTSLRALFVRSGIAQLAFPISSVSETLKIQKTDMIEVVRKKAIRLRNQLIPIVVLSDALRLSADDGGERDEFFVIIAHANGERAGFIVDDITDEKEIIVKPLPKHFHKLKHISSATIAGNNDVIFVLHVPQLIDAIRETTVSEKPREARKSAQTILVVDDSLNTREVEKTILQAYGYEVDTAKDGLDALDKLSHRVYDLVVTDLEMPVMDGFTLTARIRDEKKYQDIPVIIVTSRDSSDDKRRGIEVGANAYIVKGSFDQTNLIDTVESLIG